MAQPMPPNQPGQPQPQQPYMQPNMYPSAPPYPAPPQQAQPYPAPPPYAYQPAPPQQPPVPAPTSQVIPPDVYQQAAAHQLGTPLVAYTPSYTNPFLIIAIALAVIVGDAILFYIIYSLGWISFYLIAIPIIALIYAGNALAHINLRVYICSNGLLRVKGSQVDVLPWDHVESVLQKPTGRGKNTSYSYVVRRTDGVEMSFTSVLKNVRDLGATIQQEVARRLTPRVTAAYSSGQPITFGPLVISLQGIQQGKNMLPWQELQNVEVIADSLVIKKMGQRSNWAKINLSNVPNVPVLMQLANVARQRR